MGLIDRKKKERLIRKNGMIKAAERVFFKKGFENSTMDDILTEAEFTKKTIIQNIEMSEIIKIKKLGQTFIEFSRIYPGYFMAIADYENKDFDFQDDDSNLLMNECYIAGDYSFKLLNNCVISGMNNGEIINNIDPVTVCLMLWSTMLGFIVLINKKEKYINAYYDKNIDKLMEDGNVDLSRVHDGTYTGS